MSGQLMSTPANSGEKRYEQLGYIEAYDAVLNDSYAYVAYKESGGGFGPPEEDWRVRITGRHTAGAVFEPAAIAQAARAAGAQGQPWFAWGFGMEPSAGDAREVSFRVHVREGKPEKVEMVLRTRGAGGGTGASESVSFAWPG